MNEFNLQKAIAGSKVMTKSRNYTGQYLLSLEGCLHTFVHVFKMSGPNGEKLVQANDTGECFYHPIDKAFGVFAHPDNLIMAPEVRTVIVNFYQDQNGEIQCLNQADHIKKTNEDGVWRFIKTEKIVLEY